MPDLTIQIMQQCAEDGERNIGGYKQVGLGTENPSCTCKGFKYRKNCKHIKQALGDICQYHELVHGKPKVDGICPLCGGKTEYVKVGV